MRVVGRSSRSVISLVVSEFVVKFGATVPGAVRVVGLRWCAWDIPEDDRANVGKLLELLPPSPGVYAITGRHDALSGKSVLYIGEAGRPSKRKSKQKRNLAERVLVSVEDHLRGVAPGADPELYSDVWDITVRWAKVRRDLVDGVEELLIMMHSPPFNSLKVRRADLNPRYRDLVVMNAGRKGPILPIVAGHYFGHWQ